METLRRAYTYAVALVSLGLGAASVAAVLAWAARRVTIDPDPAELPLLAIAGVIVQVPVWAVHWAVARAGARRHPTDRTSTIRRAYLLLALAGATAAMASGIGAVVRALIEGPAADAIDGAAAAVTATPILLAHRHALLGDLAAAPEARLGATLRRLYLALAAAIAAAAGLDGATGLVAVILGRVAGLAPDASGHAAGAVAANAGFLAGAAMAWATHHDGAILHPRQPTADRSRADREALLPALYRAVILTFAVGATLAAVARLLDGAASLVAGPADPSDDSIDAMAAIATYGAAWWGFRRSLARDVGPVAPDSDREPWAATLERLHRYVVATVALGVGATGIARLVGLVLDIAVGSVPESATYARDLRFWVAATVTGIPAWVAFWRAPGHPRLDDREVASRPRRGAMYVVTFACAATVLTAGVWVAYGALGAILGRPFDLPTVAIGATLVALAAGAYHLRVLRAESPAHATPASAPPVLGPETGDDGAPAPGRPWAAIRADGAGVHVSWHATEGEARGALGQSSAGAAWGVVARAVPGGPPGGEDADGG